MQKKTLILITRGFPYGRGEAFLEHEINVISKRFDSVILFPQMSFFYSDYFDLHEIRKLPKNVKTVKIDDFQMPSKYSGFEEKFFFTDYYSRGIKINCQAKFESD